MIPEVAIPQGKQLVWYEEVLGSRIPQIPPGSIGCQGESAVFREVVHEPQRVHALMQTVPKIIKDEVLQHLIE